MVLGLLLFTAVEELSSQPRQEQVTVSARASVIILKPGVGSQASWDRTQPLHQKEVTVTDPDGRKTRIRLIEFE